MESLAEMSYSEQLRDDIARIDARTVDDEPALTALRRRLNQEQPVFKRLPIELIQQTTLWYALMMGLGHIPDSSYPSPYEWLYITHVCHYWREIALGMHELWKYIVPIRLACVTEMLARSRPGLISVLPCYGELLGDTSTDEDMEGAYEEIFSNLHRVQYFSIRSWRPTAIRTLVKMDDISTLSLRHVPFHEIENYYDHFSAKVLEVLAEDGLPMLEYFKCEIFKGSFNIISPLFRTSLHHLCLPSVVTRDSPSDLLHILGTLSGLRSLELGVLFYAQAEDTVDSTLNAHPIVFPHLQLLKLNIYGDSVAPTVLLNELEVRGVAQVIIEACQWDYTDYGPILPAITTRLQCLKPSTFRSLQVRLSTDDTEMYRSFVLDFYWETISAETLRAMAKDPNHTPPTPNLQLMLD